MKIALDVEGVLADTHEATQQRSDMLEPHECPPPDWDFPSEEHFDEFMHVSQNLWHNHHEDIQPLGSGLADATRWLDDQYHVDVVTNRTGVDEQMQQWLERWGIHYDTFHSVSGSKVEYGDYDVHIDDSPSVAKEVVRDGRRLFFINRPYNEDIHFGAMNYLVKRVDSVTEVRDIYYVIENTSKAFYR